MCIVCVVCVCVFVRERETLREIEIVTSTECEKKYGSLSVPKLSKIRDSNLKSPVVKF